VRHPRCVSLYNGKELRVEYLSSLILQPEDGPHVRPKHVVVRTLIIFITEVNIVVFDCVYSTRNSLPLSILETKFGNTWNKSENLCH